MSARCTMILVLLLCALAPLHAGERREITAVVLERLQELRAGAELAPLERDPALDRAAAERARTIAASADRERLAQRMSLEDDLRRAGFPGAVRAAAHLDLERGHADPAAALTASLGEEGERRRQALDPGYDRVGLGLARGADGWKVLVTILAQSPPPLPSPRELEDRVFDAVNRIRAERGLAPLVRRSTLDDLAREHSADMARRSYMAHRSPEGHDVSDRAEAIGLRYRSIAENLQRSRGIADPATNAVESWVDSAGHRENLLGAYRDSGVGVAIGDDGEVYFTQVFVAP